VLWPECAHQIANEHDEDDLLAWAADALPRGVHPIDTSSLDSLRRSFAHYAIEVHKQMLDYIDQQ
jgi:hypothetical protein